MCESRWLPWHGPAVAGHRAGRAGRGRRLGQGGLDVQDEAGGRGQGGQGFRAEVLLLIELLPVGPAGEVGVQGAARLAGVVLGAAVPQMTVEDHDGAGRGDEPDLAGVGGGRIGQRLTGRLAATVGPRHGPGRGHGKSAEILDRPGLPDLVTVLDESVLHRLIGSPLVMADQLSYIAERATLPHILVQVVPAGNGANAGLSGGFALASCDGVPDTLRMEAEEDVTAERRSLVRRAANIYVRVHADALPRAASRTLILAAAEQWKTT
jgi:hypothetical protein